VNPPPPLRVSPRLPSLVDEWLFPTCEVFLAREEVVPLLPPFALQMRRQFSSSDSFPLFF